MNEKLKAAIRGSLALSLCAAAAVFGLHSARAQENTLPRLDTNERYVKEVTAASALHIKDTLAVFKFVLDSLPERVNVFPTENYFYIRFLHDGVPYAGNIRFEPVSRDQGKVQFGYYPDLAPWNDEMKSGVLEVLDAGKGVVVEKMDRLVYRVSYAGKSVVFGLNDLSGVQPPPGVLGSDEKYLGPIFDESAFRFFLVYNMKLRIFHYVLDETAKVWDDLVPSRRTDRILIGRRSGFAFYRDERHRRKILIGAYEGNSRINNYFDGPFDQLPENFIQGEELRQAIVAADPSVKGKIDRLGNFTAGEGRFLIHPYMLYRQERDLYIVDQCATDKKAAASHYYLCFVIGPDDAESRHPRPLALTRNGRRKK